MGRYQVKTMASHTRRDGLAHAAMPDAGVVRSSFSTYASEVDQQLLAWRDRVGHVVDVLPSKAQLTGGFHGHIDRYAVDDFVFTDSVTDAVSLERSVARVSTDVRRSYVFHVFVQGEVDTGVGVKRQRSTPNSRGVRVIGVPSRSTVRRPGSSERVPAVRTTGRSGAPRRTNARSRATSTLKANGLVM